jgi:histidinol phosphatase-like enzyme (inositol monophosphatase family)
MPDPIPEEALAFAAQLVDASGAIIRQSLDAGRHYTAKSDSSPVTEIDRRVEATLRSMIERAFPDHGILGEEYGSAGLDRDFVWVLDPIDGTKAFITGIPTFGTLIALAYRGIPILGVIDHPVTGERWLGADGHGTMLNGIPVRTRTASLDSAILTTGGIDAFSDSEFDGFSRLRRATNWCVYGGGCLAYGRLASGAIDLGVECGHDPFDFCALVPIVTNAGGTISDWEGNPLTIHSGHRYLVSGTPSIHARALELLTRPDSRAA